MRAFTLKETLITQHFIFSTAMSSVLSIRSFLDTEKLSQKLKDLAKLMLIMAPLIIALVTLVAMSMYQAQTEIDSLNAMVNNLKRGEAVRAVVDSLQRERGMSCVWMNSLGNRNEDEVRARVAGFRNETDSFWDKIEGWKGDKRFPEKSAFTIEINNFRGSLSVNITSFSPVLDYYTGLIDYLLHKMLQKFTTSSEGKFWITLDAYYSILKVKDIIGMKRAIGGAFFASPIHNKLALQTFTGLTKTSEYLFETAQSILPKVAEDFDKLTKDNPDLIAYINEMEYEIFNGNTSAHKSNPETSTAWFYNMTNYINLFSVIEADVISMLSETLQVVSREIKTQFYIVLGIVILMAIVCPPSLAIYSFNYQMLMGKIKKFTFNIQTKQKELTKEKQKTELLLHQLLPKAIAKDLFEGKTVIPEHFDSVTVFFSDIKGFTSLSATSTPFEITEFLNKLYTNCDAILGLYDCYKVETIGDAYLVASGVPHRNLNHSEQVCTMSLDMLKMMSKFPIPHRPWENLLMRIGCHTGALAAGVVGLKMPRYCLFGDTVNTGARMESTGFPNRIQVSAFCKDHLEQTFPGKFIFLYRDTIIVKGKGNMETYWILGKKGFNFKIDLAETERLLEATEYWRIGENGVK